MTTDKLTVGQEVRVFDVNGRRRSRPQDGWPGEVVKVGRALVTIRRGDIRREQVFRLESQTANDDYGHQWYRTLDQVELMRRRREATAVLRGAAITLEREHRLTLEQIEALAGLVRSFEPGSEAAR